MTKLQEIAIIALERAYKIHQELGPRGEELVEKNQFGDKVLRVDIEAEKAVIDTFIGEKIPIRFISEEHGVVDLVKNPIYLGILDGLDGSNMYLIGRGIKRYGTMFGIFTGLDPLYDDYLFSGIMEHTANKLYYSLKGKGSKIKTTEGTTRIRSSGKKILDHATRIYIDEHGNDQKWHPFMKKVFSDKLSEFQLTWLGSSAMYYTDLAAGNADLVLECTYKSNLEKAVAFGLISESDGVMVSLDGIGLGQRKYLKFSQDKHIPVVSACTMELAQQLVNKVR